MPRLTASKPMTRLANAPARLPAPRRAAKKQAPPPDRLSSRALFFRRVRRSLKPALWVCAGLLVIGLGSEAFRAIPKLAPVASPAGSIRHGLAALAGYAGFRVTNIQINGAATTKPDAIDAAIGVQRGAPIFGLSLAVMRQRLEQLGPVQTASVARALPGTLVITITERNGFAIWQTGNPDPAQRFALIDAAGNVIADQDAVAAKRREPSLLLLSGPDAPANAATLIGELKAAPAVLAHVAAASRVDGLRWNLVLKNSTLVKLPVDNEAKAVVALGDLQTRMALLDRPVEVIDLRFPNRMVVRPYPRLTLSPPAVPSRK